MNERIPNPGGKSSVVALKLKRCGASVELMRWRGGALIATWGEYAALIATGGEYAALIATRGE